MDFTVEAVKLMEEAFKILDARTQAALKAKDLAALEAIVKDLKKS